MALTPCGRSLAAGWQTSRVAGGGCSAERTSAVVQPGSDAGCCAAAGGAGTDSPDKHSRMMRITSFGEVRALRRQRVAPAWMAVLARSSVQALVKTITGKWAKAAVDR